MSDETYYEPCDDCGEQALVVYDDGKGNRLCAACYAAWQEATIESDIERYQTEAAFTNRFMGPME